MINQQNFINFMLTNICITSSIYKQSKLYDKFYIDYRMINKML